MNCPYCGDGSHGVEVGSPTVALLVAHAVALGFGPITAALAASLVAGYRITGKKIYKCTLCERYFIA